MLTGKVAIHTAVPRKMMQPTVSSTLRTPVAAQLGAHPGEEQGDGEEHNAEDVVRRALNVSPDLGGRHLGCRVGLSRFGVLLRQLVLVHRERCRRGVGIGERIGVQPGVEGRAEVGSEPGDVEVGEVFFVGRRGVDPLEEHGDVDLRLGLGETLGASGLDAQRIDPTGRLGGLAVPAVGLVAAPSRGDGGDGEQHRGDDLDPVLPSWLARRSHRRHVGAPVSSQGIVTSPPTTASC